MVVRELFASLGFSVESEGLFKALATFEVAKIGIEKLAHVLEDVKEKIVGAIEHTAHEAHELELMSIRTGMSTEKLQELGYAASLTGGSLEGMARTFKFLEKNAGAAAKKGGDASTNFGGLGVSVKDAAGKMKEPSELFMDIAEAIKNMEDPYKRVQAAQKVFGRQGTQMLPTLVQGRKGLEGMAEEAHLFGVILDEETIKAGAEFELNLKKVNKISEGLTKTLGAPFLGVLSELSEEFVHWAKQNLPAYLERARKNAKLLAKGLKELAESVKWMLHHYHSFLIVLGAIALAIGLVHLPALTALAGAYIAAGWAAVQAAVASAAAWLVATGPIILAAAALALVGFALEDIYEYLTGGDSLIGELGPKWTAFIDSVLKPKDDDPWWLVWFKAWWRTIFDLSGAFEKLGGVLSKVFGPVFTVLMEPLHDLLRLLDVAWGIMKRIGGGISGAAGAVADKFSGLGSYSTRNSNSGAVQFAGNVAGAYADSFNNPNPMSAAAGLMFPGFGGGSSPAASAASAMPRNSVMAPQVTASVVVNAQTGASAKEIGDVVGQKMTDWGNRWAQDAAEATQ